MIFIDLLNLFTEGVGEGVALILKIGLDSHTYCVWEGVGEGVALFLKLVWIFSPTHQWVVTLWRGQTMG